MHLRNSLCILHNHEKFQIQTPCNKHTLFYAVHLQNNVQLTALSNC